MSLVCKLHRSLAAELPRSLKLSVPGAADETSRRPICAWLGVPPSPMVEIIRTSWGNDGENPCV